MLQTYDSRQKIRELTAEYLTSYSVIIAVITYLYLILSIKNCYGEHKGKLT